MLRALPWGRAVGRWTAQAGSASLQGHQQTAHRHCKMGRQSTAPAAGDTHSLKIRLVSGDAWPVGFVGGAAL